MITKTKNLAVLILSLSLIGCNIDRYNMGKKDDIANQAKSYKESIDWAQSVKKESTDGKFTFKEGEPKCNLFVYDVIYEAVGGAPHNGYHPHTAKKWASSDCIRNWQYMGTSETWQAGDVIAKEINYTNASGHCGIAVSSTEVVAAGISKVSQGVHGLNGATVRRYIGD
ncbi:hypothetical protein [Candidatus Cardinium hertigii]|uniref:CHAP domain-containing protein n=1 Tax=Candidatus Cardinium hertigii TaxID=247481 RepID=A0A2Z3LGS7_9BACT|nr:hypothetical protein [Candidatus Cardinium hertigii]AWN81594.1 hypothetical protein DK880_00262 [Candidatus Cardinium hertigii]